MQLSLVEDENGFDDAMLDACRRIVLTQTVTTDLAAIQVATVVQATIEDGESSDRLEIHAMTQLIDYIARRAEQTRAALASGVISEVLDRSSMQ